MRPRTKVPIPEPTGTEYENFDRLVSTLVKAKPLRPKKSATKRRKKSKAKA